MGSYTREDRRYLSDYEDDGLSAKGRKNAQHAEEIHDEVLSTCQVMASFLKRQIESACPDDWQQACVEAAFDSCEGEEFRALLPNHYDLEHYDVRSLAVVMEYNLPMLVFERGAVVSPREIRAFVTVRNLYEHRSPRLNYRNWRSDREMICSFRSKMQADDEMADEPYTVDSLPQMEEDSASYLAKLDALQHQIEAVTNTILGLDKRLGDNAQADEEQSAEIHRQREANEAQFAELHRQKEADEEHDRLIALLSERDARQHKEILSLAALSVMSIGVSLAALLKRK